MTTLAEPECSRRGTAASSIVRREPAISASGTFPTQLDVRIESVTRGNADNGYGLKQEQFAML
jgi:hypothetical protein